ncbi:hypothetical protein [Labrys wisconsinensis]|uniref:DUF304 domain-containing protein n=1 Tax=Labrys wisconsinensis TaxID=425677 RepID=A0ABU0J1T6_9HYPH|nr:hypothetical protein [Labrys wisconsinensis]MDQ0467536.1 hypothetical protein [Labrys wisconsinensis]
MSGLLRLNEAARNAVVKALAPAEPIVFVTTPDPREAGRAAWPTAAAGALLAVLAAPIAFIALQAIWDSMRYGGALSFPIVMALIAVPVVLMGCYLMLTPHAAERRARDTVILVTDRRLMTLSLSGKPARALPANAILGVERRKVERGYGTLEVRHEAADPGRGDTAETILAGIDDVLEAESAIRRLSTERSVTLIEPVH